MEIKLPPMLAQVTEFPPKEREELKRKSRNWMTLYKFLKELTELQLLKILILELEGPRRPVVLTRCISRYRSLRMDRENRELFQCAGIAEKEKPNAGK